MLEQEIRNVGRDQFIATLSDWIESRPPSRRTEWRMRVIGETNRTLEQRKIYFFINSPMRVSYVKRYFFYIVEMCNPRPTAQN